jgi:hypothetical protein
LRQARINELRRQADDEQAAMKAARESLIDAKNDELEIRKNAINAQFEQLMSAEAIQAQALKIMIEGQQNEIVALLESYYPQWKNAGVTFANLLAEGITTGGSAAELALANALGAIGAVTSNNAIPDFAHTFDGIKDIFSGYKEVMLNNAAMKPGDIILNLNIDNAYMRDEAETNRFMGQMTRHLQQALNDAGIKTYNRN